MFAPVTRSSQKHGAETGVRVHFQKQAETGVRVHFTVTDSRGQSSVSLVSDVIRLVLS